MGIHAEEWAMSQSQTVEQNRTWIRIFGFDKDVNLKHVEPDEQN